MYKKIIIERIDKKIKYIYIDSLLEYSFNYFKLFLELLILCSCVLHELCQQAKCKRVCFITKVIPDCRTINDDHLESHFTIRLHQCSFCNLLQTPPTNGTNKH